MSEIKSTLNKLVETVGSLPTRADLNAWKWQWTGIGLAAFAAIVGGIIGGLSWIKPDAPPAVAPQPIIISVPTMPTAK